MPKNLNKVRREAYIIAEQGLESLKLTGNDKIVIRQGEIQ
jgi:hypothetical protein